MKHIEYNSNFFNPLVERTFTLRFKNKADILSRHFQEFS